MKRLIILALLALVVSACSGDDDTTSDTELPANIDPNAVVDELPDDFPLPVPDGADVQTAARQEHEDEVSYGGLIKFEEGRYDELVDFYDEFFDGRTEDIQRTESTAERAGVSWTNSEGLIVTVSQTVGSVTLAVTVPPGAL